MKIGIHCNQFDGRGSGKVPFDYGFYLNKIYGHDIVYITSNRSDNGGLERINKHFKSILYDRPPVHMQPSYMQVETNSILESIVSDEEIEFLHLVKSGENDNVTPSNCKTAVQCVFNMHSPHGDVYAGVSKYLANKYNKTEYVPHIISYKSPSDDYRKKYNISKDYFVVGRHGGIGQFNIPFVRTCVEEILKHRTDIFFLFLSTEPFIQHERVLFIPWVNSEQDIFNFINACDVMLHARTEGETFGLAVAEFSVSNKPIITWSGCVNERHYPLYDKSHIDILQDRAIIYNDKQDLLDILFSINREFVNQYCWDKYSTEFSSENVIKRYKEVFKL